MASKRVQYTAKFKLEVVKFAEVAGVGNRAASRHFTVPEVCIRRWRKQQEALSGTNKKRKAFRGPKKGRFPEIEEEKRHVNTRNKIVKINGSIIKLRLKVRSETKY